MQGKVRWVSCLMKQLSRSSADNPSLEFQDTLYTYLILKRHLAKYLLAVYYFSLCTITKPCYIICEKRNSLTPSF